MPTLAPSHPPVQFPPAAPRPKPIPRYTQDQMSDMLADCLKLSITEWRALRQAVTDRGELLTSIREAVRELQAGDGRYALRLLQSALDEADRIA